jgi:deoxyribonuclease V
MQLNAPHPWNLAPAAARTLQRELAMQLDGSDPPDFAPRHVAGVDVGFEAGGAITRAAVMVLRLDDLQPVDCAIARRATHFPYVPGLLSFREIPAVLDALAQLRIEPDALLCDGQGIAHPRRLGIAAHLGLITGVPSLGVAKSLLTGSHGAVPEQPGRWTALCAGAEIIGAVLRTRSGVKPLYISRGHRLCLETAIALVLRCVTRYRLPETTRWADGIASRRAPVLKHLPAPLRARLAEGNSAGVVL